MRNEAAISSGRSFTDKTPTNTTALQAPNQAAPNSSRKRLYSPMLSRNTANLSHSAKMSTLFGDAASTLQYARTPPRHSHCNIRKPRITSSQTRFTRFGSAHNANLMPAPMLAPRCSSDDNVSALKRPEQGYETLDRPPIRGCPTTPSRPRMRANDFTADDSLTDVPEPSITTDSVGFTAASQASFGFSDNPHAREPINRSFATPVHFSALHPKTPAAIDQPDVKPWKFLQSSPPVHQSDSDDEEHSTHGVRLIMPYPHCEAEEAQQASIEAWLEQVLGIQDENVHIAHDSCDNKTDGHMAHDTVLLGESALGGSSTDSDSQSAHEGQPPYRRLSNKENIPPPLPPRELPPPYKSPTPTPSRFQSNACQSTMHPKFITSIAKFTHPLSPGGNILSVPPKRRKPCVNNAVGTPSKPEKRNPQDFTIHDDGLAAALAKLSPSVECHRKGRGPKRVRCASYWDMDVFEPDSPAYPSREYSESTDGQGKLLCSGQ